MSWPGNRSAGADKEFGLAAAGVSFGSATDCERDVVLMMIMMQVVMMMMMMIMMMMMMMMMVMMMMMRMMICMWNCVLFFCCSHSLIFITPLETIKPQQLNAGTVLALTPVAVILPRTNLLSSTRLALPLLLLLLIICIYGKHVADTIKILYLHRRLCCRCILRARRRRS